MPQSDEPVILYLLKRWQKEALHHSSSMTVLQRTLQITLEVIGWDYAAVSKLSNMSQWIKLADTKLYSDKQSKQQRLSMA